jgi:REP-associated tyrosine transposase
MRTCRLAHSVYRHQYHVVWGTKRRRPYLKPYVAEELEKSLKATIKKYPTLHLEEFNTGHDHVHLQIEIPPNIEVAKAVQVLKQQSSKHLRLKFPFIRRLYLESNIWSVGYFSSTVGLNEEVIRRYIEDQDKHEIVEQDDSLA